MAGGSQSSSNKIGLGYALAARPTGVDHAGKRAWRNFGQQIEPPIGRSTDQAAALAGMAENCGFSLFAWGDVAPIMSHGMAFLPVSQRLSLDCRLIAGLKAQGLAQLRSRQRRVEPSRAASPFCGRHGPTRVASASRHIQQISGQAGPDQCLKLRLGQFLSSAINGSGPGAVLSTPENGVGGTASLVWPTMDAWMRSAGRVNGAESLKVVGIGHRARAPRVERGRKATPRLAAVNKPSQFSVDNAK